MVHPQRMLDGDASPLVSRSEGTPSETGCNIYTTRPSDVVIERFLAHVRETGQPETFSTLCREPPPADSPPKFLRKFDIDRKLRSERDMAPCAICSPWKPKFLHDGFLVWYPQEAVIRAIGPECGDAIFGGTAYAEAFADFTREERERNAVEFLERNLRKALEMVVALERIRPGATEAEALHYKFCTYAPRIHGELRRVKKEGGALNVTVVIDKNEEDENRVEGPRGFSKAESEYDAYDVMFGHLPDTTMLLKQFDPLALVRAIEGILIGLPRFESDEKAFFWICDRSPDLETLEALGADLRECAQLYLRLDSDLRRATAFFSETVFDALNSWGQHEANQFDLAATVVGGTYTLAHMYEYPLSENVKFVPDFGKLAARGDWPGFE